MRTSHVERRLTKNSKRMKKIRAELSMITEQHRHMAEEADAERVRSLVADAPSRDEKANRAQRHADKLTEQRSKLTAELTQLELLQDELLDQLG